MCHKGNTAETPVLIIKLAAPGADMNIKAAGRDVAEQKHHCPPSTIHCPLYPGHLLSMLNILSPPTARKGARIPLMSAGLMPPNLTNHSVSTGVT